MGKNFPQVKSLKEKPSYLEKTLQLIENSFNYQSPYSFEIDFAALIDQSNHHNCFVFIDENENILAHVGVKDRVIKINDTLFTISMLGGIAVDEKHRGQGHFQTLIQDVMAEKRSDTALFLLWSDQEKLYNKFGFHLCGGQYELSEIKSDIKEFKKTTYSQLSSDHQQQIQNLYQSSFEKTYLTSNRNIEDWKLIEKITSSELFIKEINGKIISYFFKGKGQDLTDIIHEYGTINEIASVLKEARAFGKVWTGAPFIEDGQEQYQFMSAIGDKKLFADFIRAYTKEIIIVREVNPIKQEVYFDFNGETIVLNSEEFLRGIFGPAPFEELGEIKPIFISGLDSI